MATKPRWMRSALDLRDQEQRSGVAAERESPAATAAPEPARKRRKTDDGAEDVEGAGGARSAYTTRPDVFVAPDFSIQSPDHATQYLQDSRQIDWLTRVELIKGELVVKEMGTAHQQLEEQMHLDLVQYCKPWIAGTAYGRASRQMPVPLAANNNPVVDVAVFDPSRCSRQFFHHDHHHNCAKNEEQHKPVCVFEIAVTETYPHALDKVVEMMDLSPSIKTGVVVKARLTDEPEDTIKWIGAKIVHRTAPPTYNNQGQVVAGSGLEVTVCPVYPSGTDAQQWTRAPEPAASSSGRIRLSGGDIGVGRWFGITWWLSSLFKTANL